MSRFLCISVTFLDPFFHGQGDGDNPEWPPSPMRLFQAILAGSRTGARQLRWSVDDQVTLRDAFLWLERRPPPEIITPEASPAPAYTLFVPNNDSDTKPNRQERLTSKVARPHRLVQGGEAGGPQTLHYLWGISEEDRDISHRHAETLIYESRHLMALGWGIDQVVGRGTIITSAEASKLPGERWQPWRDNLSGGNKLRVPILGSLDDLEAVYESFCRQLDGGMYNPPQPLERFDSVRYT